ncbi:sugar transporter, partial [Streptomyces albus subsp. albus]
MKRKLIAAIGVAGMLVSVAACGSDDKNSSADPKDRKEDLTVWLMGEAQSTWPELVKDVNAEFNKKYPGVKVKVQYQQWADKVKKLDTSLGASSLYFPGRYWYAAMSYVAAYGGQIASYDEGSKEWKAALSTPEAQKGIQHFVDLVKKYNKADVTKDEQDHANVMANEKAAVIYGQAWEAGSVTTGENGNPKLEGKIATAGMPGPEGKALPSFIGGSDLATISKSKVQDLGEEWIGLFTNAKSMEVLASKNILPNNEKQLEPLKQKPETAAIANAVPDAWFTPIAPGWASVEKE